MPRDDEQNEAILKWARGITTFANELGTLALMVSDEVRRIDGELAELRDELVAIANRQSSTDRALARHAEHLP